MPTARPTVNVSAAKVQCSLLALLQVPGMDASTAICMWAGSSPKAEPKEGPGPSHPPGTTQPKKPAWRTLTQVRGQWGQWGQPGTPSLTPAGTAWHTLTHRQPMPNPNPCTQP